MKYWPVVVLLVGLLVTPALAADLSQGASLSSGNFTVLDPQHAAFGAVSSSSSQTFRVIGSIGDIAIGSSSAGTFAMRAGFLYYPLIVAPTISGSLNADNTQATLNWSAAQLSAGLSLGGYAVCSKIFEGSFNCSSVGNVTTATVSVTALDAHDFIVQALDALGNVVAESNEITLSPASIAPSRQPGGGAVIGPAASPVVSVFPPGITPTLTPQPSQQLNLTGAASPGAIVHIMINGNELGTTKANNNGSFSFSHSVTVFGNINLGLWALDTSGRRSTTWTFVVQISSTAATTISGLLMPPTVSVSPKSVATGGIIKVAGFAVPGSSVRINLPQLSKDVLAVANADGSYSTDIITVGYAPGNYIVRARMEMLPAADKSPWSENEIFSVGAINKALAISSSDINGDGRVDIIDFAILKLLWQEKIDPSSPRDLNHDGKITLADFSIMAYYWTGNE